MPRESSSSPVHERRRFAAEVLQKAVTQGGLTLLVEGLAGMGKTYLLREIAEAAPGAADWPVYFVNADEIERGEPYSFIERFAAGVIADWDFIPDARTQPIPVARECVRRFRETAPDGAVVLIDDAQWIDAESQRVLRYVIPRIHRRKVLLAFGVRTPHEDGSFGEVLTELVVDPLDIVRQLEPLTIDQVRDFAADRLGTGISSRTAERLLHATSGSFLRLDSILAQLTPVEVAQLHLAWDLPIRGIAPGDNPLLHQFHALSPAARATTELVCLAGHEISRADLAEAAALLGEPVHLAEPSDAGVLSESGFGATIVPRHALVAQAVRSTLTADRVREVSRALATVTTGYRSMRHALQGADRWTDELGHRVMYYVAEAVEQGSTANASEILRAALELATEQAPRQDLLISLALVHLRAKNGYVLLDLLEEFEQLPPSLLREFIVVMVSAHRVDQEFPHQRVMDMLVAPSTDPDDRTIVAFLSFMLVIMTMRTADTSPVPGLIDFAKGLFEQAPAEVASLSDPRLGWMVAPREYRVLLDCYQVVHHQQRSEMDEVRRSLPELMRRIDEMPDGPTKVDALVAVAGAELAIGELERGYALSRRSVELMDRVGEPWAAGTARLILADCLVLRGEFAEAAALIELCEEIAFDVLDVETRLTFAALRAVVAAVTGAPDPGWHLARAGTQRDVSWEGYEPDRVVIAECELARVADDAAAVLAATADARVAGITNTRRGFLTYRAHALIDVGELEHAAELIDDLAASRGIQWQEYWGTLDWLRARLAEARGDLDRTRRHYADAVERGGLPLPKALTLRDFGEFLVRVGDPDQGRQALQSAAALLGRMGAEGYLPRVERGLAAVPGRGQVGRDRLLSELTDRERQIVKHLADGRSNNQIAESLAVSVATVRSHVSNLLRKLQLSSRGEVARLLRESSTPTEDASV